MYDRALLAGTIGAALRQHRFRRVREARGTGAQSNTRDACNARATPQLQAKRRPHPTRTHTATTHYSRDIHGTPSHACALRPLKPHARAYTTKPRVVVVTNTQPTQDRSREHSPPRRHDQPPSQGARTTPRTTLARPTTAATANTSTHQHRYNSFCNKKGTSQPVRPPVTAKAAPAQTQRALEWCPNWSALLPPRTQQSDRPYPHASVVPAVAQLQSIQRR